MTPRELMAITSAAFDSIGLRHFITGSMASMAYSEYRSTLDIDIVADVRYGDVPELIASFAQPDYYISGAAIREAMEQSSQFNIIHPASGLKIDVMMADDSAFNRSRFTRVRRLEVAPGVVLPFASPEDIILKKLQYYREGASDKHTRDIASLLKVVGTEIDKAYIEHWASVLGVADLWETMQQRAKGLPNV